MGLNVSISRYGLINFKETAGLIDLKFSHEIEQEGLRIESINKSFVPLVNIKRWSVVYCSGHMAYG